MRQIEEKVDSVRREDKQTYWEWMLSGIKSGIKYIFCFYWIRIPYVEGCLGLILLVIGTMLTLIPGSPVPIWSLGVTIPVSIFLMTHAVWRKDQAEKDE